MMWIKKSIGVIIINKTLLSIPRTDDDDSSFLFACICESILDIEF